MKQTVQGRSHEDLWLFAISTAVLAVALTYVSSVRGAEPALDWSALAGEWVGAEKGPAAECRAGRKPPCQINIGGATVKLERLGKRARTPWKVVVHAPRHARDHGPDAWLGCGLYTELHSDPEGAYYSAHCRGRGYPADHSVEVRAHLRLDDGRLHLAIGTLKLELRRP